LDHVALHCRNLDESVKSYANHFGGKSTPVRKAGEGQSSCFVNISGVAAIR
jgi:hypothetical protein